MFTFALMLLATSSLGRLVFAVLDYRKRWFGDGQGPLDEPTPPEPRRMPVIYMPLGCGLAVMYQSFTGSCMRRRGHSGRCVAESEFDDYADKVMPASTVILVDQQFESDLTKA